MAAFQSIVNVLAYTLSLLTFLSPAPSLLRAYRSRDLGELSIVPLVAMALNSFVWLAYGWLAESIFPLFATMACCEVFSIVYVSVYLTLTPHRGYCIKVLLLALSGVVLVALYSALGLAGVTNQSRHSVATVVGIIADVGSLVMYLSPFETIVHVIKTKNASSMPIHLCLVGAIGNAVWVIYAILVSDLIVLIPNSICSTVGWIQVAIYFVYRPSRAVNAAGTVELDVPTKAQPPSPVIHATTYTAVRTPTADALA